MIRQQIFLVVRDEHTGRTGEVTVTVDFDKLTSHGACRASVLGALAFIRLGLASDVSRFTLQHEYTCPPRVVDPLAGEQQSLPSGGPQ